ncbi:GDSL esterase/lipase CPRD49-like [Bidens hawaiensis]|uniref:GDSL esterase/lipase CPRD49-like n=1 Tax=Bidens hawaiensis TaxID=980011 RepID=UPI004048EF82
MLKNSKTFFLRGATLATLYARKADIFVRGYAGWNSTQALQVIREVFPTNDLPPSLVIVYFGGNDVALEGASSHVELSKYVKNMTTIAEYLQNLSETTRLLFLTAPPVNETQMAQMTGIEYHTNERRQEYADECEKLFQDMGINVINLCNLFKQHDDWETTFLIDGMHFTEKGSQVVAKEILKTIKEADWKPSLYWQDMASDQFQGGPLLDVNEFIV